MIYYSFYYNQGLENKLARAPLLGLAKSIYYKRRGGLMVSALDSGSSGLGSSPGQGHCVVFLGKTLYSHSASLHPGVQMGTSKYAGGNPAMD